jgi:Nucleotidyltransferase domain
MIGPARFEHRLGIRPPEDRAMSITTTNSRHGITFPIDLIAALCKKYQVEELSLFGSVLRSDFGPDSDIDFLAVFDHDDYGPWIDEFHGKSAIGCIPDGADLTLVQSPGGTLKTLLVVIGKGKVHRSSWIQFVSNCTIRACELRRSGAG